MRKRLVGLAAASVGLAVFPVATARAQDASCIDVTVTQAPPGVSVSTPYPCACGSVVKVTPIPGGARYTINLGCPR